MSNDNNLHVTQGEGRWQVKQPGVSEPVVVTNTQAKAIQLATEIQNSRAIGGEVVIHRRDGKIRESNTVNRRDQFPPKG